MREQFPGFFVYYNGKGGLEKTRCTYYTTQAKCMHRNVLHGPMSVYAGRRVTMKKFISLVLLLAMALTLGACGRKAAPAPAAPTVTAEPTPEPTPDSTALVDAAAELYAQGKYADAFESLKELERSGVDGVSGLLGICSYFGLGTEVDADRAVTWLTEAADEGDVYAQYLLADAAEHGNGTRRDQDEAVKGYVKFVAAADGMSADERNFGAVMTALAECYANGKGVMALPSAAGDAADKAAAAADLTPFDQMALGTLYEGELLGKADTFKAEVLFKQAAGGIKALADEGNVQAQKLLGDLYLDGKGSLSKDYAKAMEAYLAAAEEGYAPAQAQLGYMYQNALGVEADYNEAMEWNNRAAQQGNAQGQAQIGYLYHMGLGVTQNLDEAGRWYSRAVESGNTWAAAMLEQTEITNPHANFEAHA